MLYGRDAETATIDRLLQGARAGRSGALVLRGEAGIGKSALLAHAECAAADMRVLRATGTEYERSLPYAGLHLMLRRHLDRVDALPGPQGRALRGALAMEGGAGGDRFLVGLAVLTLLSDLAEERPLLCLVDDAQWLDEPTVEALLFAVRRLEAEPIVMLLAARDADPAGRAAEFTAPGLPELRLTGLDDRAADALLTGRAAALPAPTRQEILVEAQGNPLALLELPAARRAAPGEPSSTYTRLRSAFADRVAALPDATRTLLLLAAVNHQGDLAVLLPAAERLGASVADLEPAERDGLVTVADERLEFRHPLIRSAAADAATFGRRLAAHRALAATYRAAGDRCHVWHLAAAATGPEEPVAAELEEAAEEMRSGGGVVSTAVVYERAAALSPDPRDRGRRLALAARAAADAGRAEQAVALAGRAARDVTDPVARADLVMIHATLADEQDRGREAFGMLGEAAGTVADRDPVTAGYLLFQAAMAASNAGDLPALRATADRAERLGLPRAENVRALADLFEGQSPLSRLDPARSVAALRRLIDVNDSCYGPRDLLRAVMWRLMIADVAEANASARALELRFRAEGSIGLLSLTLMPLARTELMLGRTRDALALATEGMRVAADTGQHRIRVYQATTLAHLAALGGDEERCLELTAEPLARDIPPSSVHAVAARSLLDLGLGRHEAAFDRLAGVLTAENRAGSIASVPDLVEAAVRSGRAGRGREAAAWYGRWSAQVGQPWTEAIAARCAALLDDDEASYERAVALHRKDGGMPFERARTELLHGEWLRRDRRRNDARAPLHSALETFERLGAVPWADRARAELRATGEAITAERPSDALAALTPQEIQVVRLAAAGLSNREIGAQLFLSPRTVGYHLYKAYPKLGVASRGELARLDLAS
ncbi:AAA family ATPase [Actinomadura namibiensis]|uniref:DNA-binding CsgD family transcriptional regulator n=1 Tax=Actinomadura namibiensis TaxID=182080 RepID=A0A7W3LU44_ACTNM|nr:LuxR family transcriptional regulator [Actinomadura namibiensis]MBA8954334.1 DNA-binding CsgD family transcriptional regulator [Actinomadura namibiensis]